MSEDDVISGSNSSHFQRKLDYCMHTGTVQAFSWYLSSHRNLKRWLTKGPIYLTPVCETLGLNQ